MIGWRLTTKAGEALADLFSCSEDAAERIARKLAAVIRKPVVIKPAPMPKAPKVNPIDDDPKQFNVGDEVSISAVQYFNRRGTVVAIGKKLVTVKVHITGKRVKFRAGDLRLVNAAARAAKRKPRKSNPARKSIEVGDRVKISAQHLRSTGTYSGHHAHAKGTVTAIDKSFGRSYDPPGLATVAWDKLPPGQILAANLVKVGEREPNPKRSRKRVNNPKGEQLEAARRTFKKWHEFDPSGVIHLRGPSRTIPKTLVFLGEMRNIDYFSNKWNKRVTHYTHKTKAPYPILATDPRGKDLYIIGGRVKVTADGLVG